MEEQEIKNRVVEALAGYPDPIGRALWQIQDARRRTLDSLDRVDPARVDRPGLGGGNSLGSLLYHIAAIELDYLYGDILELPFPPDLDGLFPYEVRDASGRLTQVGDIPLEEHLRRLEAVRAALLHAFQGMSPEEFRRKRQLERYTVTPEWVLHHLAQHEAEHRGQIDNLPEKPASR
jgi:uncharacterized damage-inducible protein DinB